MIQSRSLENILQSVSDILFPAELGEKRVSINSRGVDGDTPLHVITYRRDVESVKILIEAGADINAIGDMGETPLHAAVRQENMAIIKAMLNNGADVNIKSEFNLTAAEMAAAKGNSIKKLFE